MALPQCRYEPNRTRYTSLVCHPAGERGLNIAKIADCFQNPLGVEVIAMDILRRQLTSEQLRIFSSIVKLRTETEIGLKIPANLLARPH